MLWSPGKRVSSYGPYLEPREPKATAEFSLPLEAGDTLVTLTVEPVGTGPSQIAWHNPRFTANNQPAIPLGEVATSPSPHPKRAERRF